MLAVDAGGSFVGAGYTELNVVVRASWLLAVLAMVCGFVLVVAVTPLAMARLSSP